MRDKVFHPGCLMCWRILLAKIVIKVIGNERIARWENELIGSVK